MSLSVETAILLPGEVLLWKGQDYRGANRQFPHYYLTDERMLVQTTKISYKSFDLCHILAVEFEQGKAFSYLTISFEHGEIPNLTLKLKEEASAVHHKLLEARERSIQRALSNGEEIPRVVYAKLLPFFFYNFIKQNSIVFFYAGLAILAAWSNHSFPGILGLGSFLLCLLFFSTRTGLHFLDKTNNMLRNWVFKLNDSENLVVSRRIIIMSGNLILGFWCVLILLMFLSVLIIYPQMFTR
ncbi:hypothetical protein [Candidatus Chlorohelix sp.]|uniref:hypothetical protein n=1 Tax=Candidatus Chlorohelix sp. TaxID=3139201 RepID=UPI003035A2F8